MFRRSDRYVLQELITPFLLGTFVVLMLVVSGKLYNDLQPIRESHAPPSHIVRSILVLLPQYLTLTLPVSTALAASLATSRLARDNEITVMRSLGRPVGRIFLPVLLFGVAVSLADLWVADRLVPWSLKAQRQFVLGAAATTPLYANEPGKTLRVENYTVTYVSSQKTAEDARRVVRPVFIDNGTLGKPGHEILTAASADYRSGVWSLHGAVRHEYGADGALRRESPPAEIQKRLPVDFSAVYQRGGSSEEFTFTELTAKAREAKRLGNLRDSLTYDVERWFRLALPLMGGVFALCAPPLALRFARTGSFAGIMLSVVTVFVAWNTLLFMKSVGFGGYLPPAAAAWVTNVVFALLGLYLLRTQE